MILIVLSCAWVAGIYLGSLVNIPPLFCLLGLAPLPLLFFPNFNRKKIIIAGFGIFLLLVSSVYAYNSLYQVDESSVRFYNDTDTATIKGMVAADPDVRDKSTHLVINVSAIQLDNTWQSVKGEVLVFVPRYPEYKYGDILQMQGQLQTPAPLDNFDYRGYLEHQGIYTTMYYPGIQVIATGKGFLPLAWIYDLRTDMSQKLAEALPEPQASLAQGILLGIRGNIPADLNTDFARSGTSHLLAISGFNLSVMAGILLAVGIWFFGRKRYLYVWLAFGAIWFYTALTGFNPPVLRAAFMVSVFLAAEALGRQRGAFAALALTAVVMTGISPYTLGDASFQLSFLAMAGLIFIQPVFHDFGKQVISGRFEDKGFFSSIINVIIESLAVTLAAIVAVGPVIAYYFGLFSLTGPLATFLLTPVQPVIMVLGALSALTGLASVVIAQIIGWLLWPFLTYMIAIVRGLGASTVSSVQVNWINPLFIAIYYLVLILALWLYRRRKKIRNMISGVSGVMKAGVNLTFGFSSTGLRLLVVPLILAAVLTTYTVTTMPDRELHVSFLDVGEGDAILLQQGSTQVLIDGGPSPQAVTLALSKQMPFWDRTIELVVLTHPHSDHLAGLVEVLKRYKVKEVIYPSANDSSPVFQEWLALIKDKEIKNVTACAGQQIMVGKFITIEVLNPQAKMLTGTESDVDNNCVALKVLEGKISFLLTGDMMQETEIELTRNRTDLACTVLKVAHHGSDTSSTKAFLAVADPQIAVISCGAGNKFGHPNEVALERLEESVGESNIYRTDIRGTISFITDGEKLWIKIER